MQAPPLPPAGPIPTLSGTHTRCLLQMALCAHLSSRPCDQFFFCRFMSMRSSNSFFLQTQVAGARHISVLSRFIKVHRAQRSEGPRDSMCRRGMAAWDAQAGTGAI